jgi:hypothetical protein
MFEPRSWSGPHRGMSQRRSSPSRATSTCRLRLLMQSLHLGEPRRHRHVGEATESVDEAVHALHRLHSETLGGGWLWTCQRQRPLWTCQRQRLPSRLFPTHSPLLPTHCPPTLELSPFFLYVCRTREDACSQPHTSSRHRPHTLHSTLYSEHGPHKFLYLKVE